MRIFVIALILVSFSSNLHAQKRVKAACGDKVTGEFTTPAETHIYEIALQANQIMEAKIIPTGDYLNFRTEFFDPVNSRIIYDDNGTFNDANKRNLEVKTGVLSGRGVYKLHIHNFGYYGDGGRVGLYTIQFTCSTQ